MHTSTMAESAKRAEQALARLAALHPKLIDLGLERSFALLQKLGDPHLHLPPTIHVAGTNGKGSVIAFLRALAEAGGVTTHVYSSPHLCRFNERIRLAGTLIDDAALADLLEEVEALNGTQQVTFSRSQPPPQCWRFRGTRLIYYGLKPDLAGRWIPPMYCPPHWPPLSPPSPVTMNIF